MTAFFSDIANFAAISQCLTPTELVRFVDQYLSEMCDIIESYGGTIDKFMGDSIMAFFGAPIFYEDHAVRGCMAAIDQQKKLVELRQRLKKDRALPLSLRQFWEHGVTQGRVFMQVRMGMACGPMVVGSLGSRRHPCLTVMGDTVNLAARFESHNKLYGTNIIVNEAMYDQVKGVVEIRKLDSLEIHGREDPIGAFEVLDHKGALDPRRSQVLEFYDKGMLACERFEFARAGEWFHKALEIDPQDGPSALYVLRCEKYATDRPADLVFRQEQIEVTQVEREQQQRLEAQHQLIRMLEEELQTAHDLQMGLMPKEPPRIQGFEITGRCRPANHVGGDFFQYFPAKGRLSICLADVTGHAMEAAIPVVMFSGILKSQMEMGSSVEELFGRLNRSLHGTLGSHTFVCFTLGELDPAWRTFRLSNSGCPYPYHYQAATGEVVELRVDAYPLGIRPDTAYPVIEVQLEPGDQVVFCSDGIIEAEDAQGELFGFERTVELIRKGCQEGLSAEALLERLMGEVRAFRGEVPQGDDQTVVVLKVHQL